MLTRAGARLFSTEALVVVNNVAKQQFTITLANDNAVLRYKEKGKNIVFEHTDVPPVFQGKGVGRLLAKYAFDHAYKNQLDVTCQCHFLAKYFKENQNNYKGLNITFNLEENE
ncbi:hypothetical protein PYW08_001725 [Mythimna loreyi]|uniref:Uncharacterized protein n=1 Tax=Mythimna loreyi TaxID=667449 RepID=A0ACC2R4U2_9NEOP|nr:hypothetical protein PYW08_001725 [Mythimna loreyi]